MSSPITFDKYHFTIPNSITETLPSNLFPSLIREMRKHITIWEQIKKNPHFTITQIKVHEGQTGKVYSIALAGLSFAISEVQNTAIFNAVEKDLINFCKEVDDSLDKKEGLCGKYHTVIIPKDQKAVQHNIENDSRLRKEFLSGHFGQFYIKLTKLLLEITIDDIKTIGSKKPTQLAKEFELCFDMLNAVGFYHVNGRPINFWSGDLAKKKAEEVPTSLSDSNVPAIAVMMELGRLLQEKLPETALVLFSGSSAVFATKAQGHCICYNASSFNEQEGFVWTAGNFHWEIERPIVTELMSKGTITKFEISFYDLMKDCWNDPKAPDEMKNEIRVVRRNSHSHDRNPSIFDPKTNNGRARPSITLAQLQNVVNKFKKPLSESEEKERPSSQKADE